MSDDLLGELHQRHSGDAKRRRGNRINVCWLERSLRRYGKLLGDHERGEVGNGDFQYHPGAVRADG